MLSQPKLGTQCMYLGSDQQGDNILDLRIAFLSLAALSYLAALIT